MARSRSASNLSRSVSSPELGEAPATPRVPLLRSRRITPTWLASLLSRRGNVRAREAATAGVVNDELPLRLDLDTGSNLQSSSSSVFSGDSAAMVPKFARKTHELKCLEFSTDGTCITRFVTRQQILDEARGDISEGYFANAARRGSRYAPLRSPTEDSIQHARNRAGQKKARNGRGRGALRGAMPMRSPLANMQRKNQFRNALTMRDMRQVDPDFTPKPALWVRQHALVVSLEKVRAIILYNKMLLFDPDNSEVQDFIKYARIHLASGSMEAAFMPFEFRALDAILVTACYKLERRFFGEIESQIQQTLGELPTKITTEQLENLRHLEQKLNYFYARSRRVQHVLQAVLDEDEDMADMYLTEKSRNPERTRNPVNHDEIETLLETHLQTVDDLTSKAELLNRAIDDTEDLIEIHLDTMQNRLLLVDLIITAITTILAFGSMITAIFGMNLQLPTSMTLLPSSQYYFLGCVLSMILLMAIAILILTRWCRRQGLYRGYSTLAKPRRTRRDPAVVASEEVRREALRLLRQKWARKGSDQEAARLNGKSAEEHAGELNKIDS